MGGGLIHQCVQILIVKSYSINKVALDDIQRKQKAPSNIKEARSHLEIPLPVDGSRS